LFLWGFTPYPAREIIPIAELLALRASCPSCDGLVCHKAYFVRLRQAKRFDPHCFFKRCLKKVYIKYVICRALGGSSPRKKKNKKIIKYTDNTVHKKLVSE